MYEANQEIQNSDSIDAQNYAKAILNILSDFGNERERLNDMQRATVNILEDFAGEKSHLESVQMAILNILDDSAKEKLQLEDTQLAVLNVLEDSADERSQLRATQMAILNMLDDSDLEKERLNGTQRAILNILDDFDLEKKKVEQANLELRKEITERKKAEEALEVANKELEAFSYSVSHDLRAPLRAIDGFSQALLEDYANRLDTTGEDYLQRVRSGSQRMALLIDDMLKLSRVTRAEMRRETVNLSMLADSVIEELRRAEPERQVEVIIQPDLQAEGDSKLLRIALVNLLANAWKFTGRQSAARIEMGTMHMSEDQVFYVRDNGAGFDMTYVHKLFGAFQRLHPMSEFPGTGVGLATVQRIIHRHGGRVWAESIINQGATFYFTLPSNHNTQPGEARTKIKATFY